MKAQMRLLSLATRDILVWSRMGDISMISNPLSGGEAAHDGCGLVNHLSDGAKVGLANDAVEQVSFEFCPHHFGDGDHCCRG